MQTSKDENSSAEVKQQSVQNGGKNAKLGRFVNFYVGNQEWLSAKQFDKKIFLTCFYCRSSFFRACDRHCHNGAVAELTFFYFSVLFTFLFFVFLFFIYTNLQSILTANLYIHIQISTKNNGGAVSSMKSLKSDNVLCRLTSRDVMQATLLQ